MSGFEAFLTGFLGRSADIIKERKDKAENYFDQAIERARTVGADNLRQRTDNYQSMLSVANNLVEQAGMPEDLVRMIANEGPGALEQAYQIYETNAASGKEVGEEFWRGVYDFSTEMTSGSNVSLEDFLSQVNGLYGSNLAATEQEGGDPFGAFIASGLGLNAMERAQERLGGYDMGGGYSAADLNAMDARPSTTRPLGDTGFGGPDLSLAIPQDSNSYNPTPEERIRFVDRFNEAVEAETQDLFDQYQATATESGQPLDMTREDFKQQASQNIATAYANTVGLDVISAFPEISIFIPEDYYREEEETSQEDATEPVEGPAEEATPTTETPTEPDPVVGEPASPLDIEPGSLDASPITESKLPAAVQENEVITNGTTRLILRETRPDGTLIYQAPDGTTFTATPQERETLLAQPGVTVGVQDFPEGAPPPESINYNDQALWLEGLTEDGASWKYRKADGTFVYFPVGQPILQ